MIDRLPLDSLPEPLRGAFEEAIPIWISGGWAMVPIAVVAFALFSLGVHVALRLAAPAISSVRERRWRAWIADPARRRGPIGALISAAAAAPSLGEAIATFDRYGDAVLAPVRRDLRVMKVCAGAAPLLGLLGTVTGMLATFSALASGGGGEQTMGMIAAGISEALITTETGLVVALPGIFLHYFLDRRVERFRLGLAHLETVCVQARHKGALAA